MALVQKGGRGEAAWTWVCRVLAVVMLLRLLQTVGFDAPMGAYLLLLGLFFGPEIIRGQLSINRRSGHDEEDDDPK